MNNHRLAAILNLLQVSSNKLNKCSSDCSLIDIYNINTLFFFLNLIQL